jgi:hypothetical protein
LQITEGMGGLPLPSFSESMRITEGAADADHGGIGKGLQSLLTTMERGRGSGVSGQCSW